MRKFTWIRKKVATLLSFGTYRKGVLVCFMGFAALLYRWHHRGSGTQPVLYLYAWSEYFPKEILTQFTQETGILVKYVTYESNEELLVKLKAYPKATYDLALPSNYIVEKLWAADLIQPIECARLRNYPHLDGRVQTTQLASEYCYAVPYIWGVTGIGVNSDKISLQSVNQWLDFWKPCFRNQLLLLEDAKELFSMLEAIQSFHGDDLTLLNRLQQLKPNVLAFQTDLTSYPFITGEVDIGMIWNGAVVKAQQKGFNLAFIWPKEGALLWTDNFVIPKYARNPEAALKFIDFILNPVIAARLVVLTHFPIANASMRPFLPPHLAANPLLFPSPERLNQAILIQSVDLCRESERELLLQNFKLFM